MPAPLHRARHVLASSTLLPPLALIAVVAWLAAGTPARVAGTPAAVIGPPAAVAGATTRVIGPPAAAADPAAAPMATATIAPTPTRPRPTFEPPPRALLTVDGVTQEAGVGTSCWGGLCVDLAPGWVAPTEPMRVRSPFIGRLRIEVGPVPTGLYLDVQRFESRVGRPFGGGEFAFWPAEKARRLGPHYVLPLAREQDVQLAREPGLYVISLIAIWKDVGDAYYGFLVEVEP